MTPFVPPGTGKKARRKRRRGRKRRADFSDDDDDDFAYDEGDEENEEEEEEEEKLPNRRSPGKRPKVPDVPPAIKKNLQPVAVTDVPPEVKKAFQNVLKVISQKKLVRHAFVCLLVC